MAKKRRYDTRINVHMYATAIAMAEYAPVLRSMSTSWKDYRINDAGKAKWAEMTAQVLERLFVNEEAVREQLREELEG